MVHGLVLSLQTNNQSVCDTSFREARGKPKTWNEKFTYNKVAFKLLCSHPCICCNEFSAYFSCFSDGLSLEKTRHKLRYTSVNHVDISLTVVKPRPNDHNMPTQHIATLLGATCVRLATLLRRVGCCWLKFDHFQT